MRRRGLSPEVTWYLEARGLEVPPGPGWVPEPGRDTGYVFDPARVDLVLEGLGNMRQQRGESWALSADQVAYAVVPLFGWVPPREPDPPRSPDRRHLGVVPAPGAPRGDAA